MERRQRMRLKQYLKKVAENVPGLKRDIVLVSERVTKS